jgi:hypothetical protein
MLTSGSSDYDLLTKRMAHAGSAPELRAQRGEKLDKAEAE